jgi:hypothetical protein
MLSTNVGKSANLTRATSQNKCQLDRGRRLKPPNALLPFESKAANVLWSSSCDVVTDVSEE